MEACSNLGKKCRTTAERPFPLFQTVGGSRALMAEIFHPSPPKLYSGVPRLLFSPLTHLRPPSVTGKTV